MQRRGSHVIQVKCVLSQSIHEVYSQVGNRMLELGRNPCSAKRIPMTELTLAQEVARIMRPVL